MRHVPLLCALSALTAFAGVAPAMADAQVVEACDMLAGDPEDSALPAGMTGVAIDAIDAARAIPICHMAVDTQPDAARLSYALGRSYLAIGAPSAAIAPLEQAAAAGHGAAMFWLAQSLAEFGQGQDPLVAELIAASAATGYPPAKAAMTATVAAPVGSGLDFGRFEKPELIRGLVEQDVNALLAFRGGLPSEASGIPQGLAIYLGAFDAEMGSYWRCPTLLPAGLSQAFMLGSANNLAQRGAIGDIVMDYFGRAAGAWEAVKEVHTIPDSQLKLEDLLRPTEELIAGFGDIEPTEGKLREQGMRDARLVHEMTACQGPDAEALSTGARALMSRVEAM